MAETPNYLEEVRRSLERTRGARRQRLDALLDPLEEAGRMDRLQGVEVSDFAPNMDAGSSPIIQASMRSGGGGNTVQMAGFRGRGQSAPIVATGGNCVNGRCGIPAPVMSQPAITQMPMMQSQPVASAPTATTAVPRKAPTTVAELRAARDQALDNFAAHGDSLPIAGAAYRDTAQNYHADASAQQLLDTQREAWERDAPVRDAALAHARAESKKLEADAILATQNAQGVKEGTAAGYASTSADLLQSVLGGKLTPRQYAAAMLKMDANTLSSSSAQPSIAQPQLKVLTPEAKYAAHFREATGALAAHVILQSANFYDLARAKPEDEVGIVVGKDEKTGEPIEQVVARANNVRPNISMNHSLNMLIDAYTTTGMLKEDWHTIRSALHNDLFAPMLQAAQDHYMKANASRLMKLPQEAREEEAVNIRERAEMATTAMFDHVLAHMEKEAARQGGGTSKHSSPFLTPSTYKPDNSYVE